jgi:hypothetical protein
MTKEEIKNQQDELAKTSISISYDQLVKVTCLLADSIQISQGIVEWSLLDAIRSVTGFNFSEIEKKITDLDEDIYD